MSVYRTIGPLVYAMFSLFIYQILYLGTLDFAPRHKNACLLDNLKLFKAYVSC